MNATQNSMKKAILMTAVAFLFITDVYSQVSPVQIQMYRNEEKGNVLYRRKGMLDGNQVRTVYFNNGMISDWFTDVVSGPHGEWPKGTGHRSLDGLAVLIGAKVKVKNLLGQDVYITPIESGYREEMDRDPVNGTIWGLEPVPGYFRPASTSPAIDADTTTYPEQWPRSLFYDLYGNNETEIKKWDGYWYGYFGRGVRNAQLESFFVMDDSKDAEFARSHKFYPIAADSQRMGLGLRVETRAFQWTHVLAEDIIFWHYDIVNLSDNDYDSTSFGFYTDPSVGSTANDARFDSQLDMAYAWAPTGKGLPDNYKTGYYGHSFLESPGNATNGIDDDEDGIIDERRDDGIDNDGDWESYTDLNGNGQWDPGEPLNDDLGTDGVGPFDLQYNGPDADGTEGNGKPDLGEPNFDKTDKDESDQIGLQAAYIGYLNDKGPTGVWPKNDNVMWDKMTGGFKDTAITNTNISMVFASGIFPLKKNQRERFSLAILFGSDLEDLVFNKRTVQSIYNANYNFAQPPYTPQLTAVAGDKKVYLYWNDVAERSYDRFLRKFDFEGYLLYRSTEFTFNEIKVVTDSKGEPVFWKPIKQWDVIDSLKGPDPIGINGASFWRGNDTGLEHAFVDTTVKNGVKYYYALVSYDKGMESIGLTPSECTKLINEEFNGTLKFIDINCAIVTPSARAAGYIPAAVNGNMKSVKQGIGTGSISVNVVGPDKIKDGMTYRVTFDSTGVMPNYKTKSFNVIRTSASGGTVDTIFSNINIAGVYKSLPTNPFDGMTVSVTNDTVIQIVDSATGWVVGSKTNAFIRARVDNSNPSQNVAWPADYEIQFYSTPQDSAAIGTTGAITPGSYVRVPVNFTITNVTNGYRAKFLHQDMDASKSLTSGDTIRILDGYVSATNFKRCYNFVYIEPPFGVVKPTDGDKFIIRTTKSFAGGDYFEFTTQASRMDDIKAKNELDRITVVPNPYVGAASWERKILYQTGRGDRKIEFTHLPAVCTIRIYTIDGKLVRTLEKNSTEPDGSLSWDLISEDGMDIAFGLYIFHVKTPNSGEHIGKFAVIK